MKFGNRLKMYRKKLNETQSSISLKSSIPQTTISDWENNKYEPTVSDVLALSKALNVTVSELLDGY